MKVFRGFPKAADKLLFHYAVLRSATARSQGVAVPFFEYNEKRFHYETYGSAGSYDRHAYPRANWKGEIMA